MVGNLQGPLSPDERRRFQAEKKQKLIDGWKELEKQAEMRGAYDSEIRKKASDFMARELAERGAKPGQIDWRDHRDVPESALGKAFATEEPDRQHEAHEENLKKQELDKQGREQKESQGKTLAAKREPIPGNMEKFNAILATRKVEKDALTHGSATRHGGRLTIARIVLRVHNFNLI
jgi:hypothetical protein